MSGLRVSLLGTPRFERDGLAIEIRPRKNVALIAYLALTGQSHSREALITLLWPELEPSRARSGLRRNLSMLCYTTVYGTLLKTGSWAWRLSGSVNNTR